MKISSIILLCSMATIYSCAQKENPKKNMSDNSTSLSANVKTDTATFGTGCFWCTEAVFQQLEGVLKATSGYSGGHVENPTYKEVCTGETGHAECLEIVYDPTKITYDDLLQVFWQVHDPTTLNKQGNDVGTQYRSAIFYHNREQKEKAEKYKAELDKSGAWENPIVTEIVPAAPFYKAEDYHQNYYNDNGSQPYCYFVIRPKVEKFQKVFKNKLKH
ncbi:MAG: peptide-methionine (S)-S-oxide reductase MsrA [Sphingobacteriales bacterium]|nr:peptide-methionine (S)-S-oxide reductase MsrA [Sphingobacteriales bacterium]